MHELRTIAIVVPGVCQSVHYAASRDFTELNRLRSCGVGLETLGDPRNIVLDGDPDFLHGFDAAFAK